jgi:hypothetical protein
MPALHPDDVTIVDGIPVTTVSRTLIDLADDKTPDELRATFRRAREMGLLDVDALEASFARVEWRPSRETLRRIIDEFTRRTATALELSGASAEPTGRPCRGHCAR